jgi:hemerythrin
MSEPLPTSAEPSSFGWSDAFTLGYGPMDDVHQEFVDLVAQLQTAPETELPRWLDVFAAHAQAHFDLEDGWMRDTEFPARDCHIDEHAAVLRSVHEVRAVLAQGDVANCRRLARELARWFPGHADYLDSALAAWMCKRQFGARPVVLRRDVARRGAP